MPLEAFFHGLFFCPFPLSLGTSSQVLISGNLPAFSADRRIKEGTVAHPVLHDGGTTCPHTRCSRQGIWGEVSKYEKSPSPHLHSCLPFHRDSFAGPPPFFAFASSGCVMLWSSLGVWCVCVLLPTTLAGRSPFPLPLGLVDGLPTAPTPLFHCKRVSGSTNCSHPFPKGSSQDFAEPQVAPT